MIAGVVPVERDVTVRHQLAHAASSRDLPAAQAMRGRRLNAWFGWLQVGCHRYSFAVDTGLQDSEGQGPWPLGFLRPVGDASAAHVLSPLRASAFGDS